MDVKMDRMADRSVNELLEKHIAERNVPIYIPMSNDNVLEELNKKQAPDVGKVGASLDWLGWNKDTNMGYSSAIDPDAEEKVKIRAVMGEEEWTRNNGHICNECAIEAGSELRCRCTWKCRKHTFGKDYKDLVAR